MIEYIRKEFIQILRETDWMDEESRSQALAKADNIDSKVGFPEFIYNDTHLNEIYELVSIFTFFKNYFTKPKLISCCLV